jgi:tRNA A58 N-methylase Trm61
MLKLLQRLFLQPSKKQKQNVKKIYHYILTYANENGHYCTFRTYADSYEGAKKELNAQYIDKKISNISIKSKNIQS